MRKRYLGFSVFVIVILMLMTFAEAYQLEYNDNKGDDKKLLANVDNVGGDDIGNDNVKVGNNDIKVNDKVEGNGVGDSNNKNEKGLVDSLINDFKSWAGFFNGFLSYGKNKVSGNAVGSITGNAIQAYNRANCVPNPDRVFPLGFLNEFYSYMQNSKNPNPVYAFGTQKPVIAWDDGSMNFEDLEEMLALNPNSNLGLTPCFLSKNMLRNFVNQLQLKMAVAFSYYVLNRIKYGQNHHVDNFIFANMVLRDSRAADVFLIDTTNTFDFSRLTGSKSIPAVKERILAWERLLRGEEISIEESKKLGLPMQFNVHAPVYFAKELDSATRAIEQAAQFRAYVASYSSLIKDIEMYQRGDPEERSAEYYINLLNERHYSSSLSNRADSIKTYSYEVPGQFIHVGNYDERFSLSRLYDKYQMDYDKWISSYNFDLASYGYNYDSAIKYLRGRTNAYNILISQLEKNYPILSYKFSDGRTFDGKDTEVKLREYYSDLIMSSLNYLKKSQDIADNFFSRSMSVNVIVSDELVSVLASSPIMPKFDVFDERNTVITADYRLNPNKKLANFYLTSLDDWLKFRMNELEIQTIYQRAAAEAAIAIGVVLVASAFPAAFLTIQNSFGSIWSGAQSMAWGFEGFFISGPMEIAGGILNLFTHLANAIILPYTARQIYYQSMPCLRFVGILSNSHENGPYYLNEGALEEGVYDRLGACMQLSSMISLGIFMTARADAREELSKWKAISPAAKKSVEEAQSINPNSLANLKLAIERSVPEGADYVASQKRIMAVLDELGFSYEDYRALRFLVFGREALYQRVPGVTESYRFSRALEEDILPAVRTRFNMLGMKAIGRIVGSEARLDELSPEQIRTINAFLVRASMSAASEQDKINAMAIVEMIKFGNIRPNAAISGFGGQHYWRHVPMGNEIDNIIVLAGPPRIAVSQEEASVPNIQGIVASARTKLSYLVGLGFGLSSIDPRTFFSHATSSRAEMLSAEIFLDLVGNENDYKEAMYILLYRLVSQDIRYAVKAGSKEDIAALKRVFGAAVTGLNFDDNSGNMDSVALWKFAVGLLKKDSPQGGVFDESMFEIKKREIARNMRRELSLTLDGVHRKVRYSTSRGVIEAEEPYYIALVDVRSALVKLAGELHKPLPVAPGITGSGRFRQIGKYLYAGEALSIMESNAGLSNPLWQRLQITQLPLSLVEETIGNPEARYHLSLIGSAGALGRRTLNIKLVSGSSLSDNAGIGQEIARGGRRNIDFYYLISDSDEMGIVRDIHIVPKTKFKDWFLNSRYKFVDHQSKPVVNMLSISEQGFTEGGVISRLTGRDINDAEHVALVCQGAGGCAGSKLYLVIDNHGNPRFITIVSSQYYGSGVFDGPLDDSIAYGMTAFVNSGSNAGRFNLPMPVTMYSRH